MALVVSIVAITTAQPMVARIIYIMEYFCCAPRGHNLEDVPVRQ